MIQLSSGHDFSCLQCFLKQTLASGRGGGAAARGLGLCVGRRGCGMCRRSFISALERLRSTSCGVSNAWRIHGAVIGCVSLLAAGADLQLAIMLNIIHSGCSNSKGDMRYMDMAVIVAIKYKATVTILSIFETHTCSKVIQYLNRKR